MKKKYLILGVAAATSLFVMSFTPKASNETKLVEKIDVTSNNIDNNNSIKSLNGKAITPTVAAAVAWFVERVTRTFVDQTENAALKNNVSNLEDVMHKIQLKKLDQAK